MPRPKNRSGFALLQTLIAIVILGMITTAMMKVALGGYMTATKDAEVRSSRHLGLGIQAQIQACLAATSFGKNDCKLPSLSGCISSEGSKVSVKASGTAPNCVVTIEVD